MVWLGWKCRKAILRNFVLSVLGRICTHVLEGPTTCCVALYCHPLFKNGPLTLLAFLPAPWDIPF